MPFHQPIRRFRRAAVFLALLALLLLLPSAPASAQLELTKSFHAESVVEPGGVVIWLLHFQNLHPFTITNVVVEDQVPQYTTFDSALSGPGWTCTPGPEAGGRCRYLQDPVPSGVTRNYRFITQIDPALPSHVTQLENCFTVTYEEGGVKGGVFEACAIAPIDPGPVDMVLEKTADPASILEPGGAITWNLAYGNQGPAIAERVMVRETVPARTTFSAAQSTPGWECPDGPAAGNLCVLRVGAFGQGDHSTARFVTVIDPDLPEGTNQIENCATLTWQGGPAQGLAPVCARVSIEGGGGGGEPPALTAWLDDELTGDTNNDGLASAGEEVSYSMTVTNTGQAVAEAVVFHLDSDPHSLLLNGTVSTSQGTVTLGNNNGDHAVQVELGSLAVNASAVITWSVAVEAPLTVGVTHLSVQGLLQGENFTNTVTDDPATAAPLDPTVTPLGFAGSGVPAIPTLGEVGLWLLVLMLASVGIVRFSKSTGRTA